MRFKSKTIWITGASSGIGKALTQALAKEGNQLILLARNSKALKEIKQDCASNDATIIIQEMDLNDLKQIDRTVSTLLAKNPQIDLLINNAGISQRSLAAKTNIEVDKRIMHTNYLGTVHLTKSLLATFMQQKKSQIATITSLTGVFGTPYRSSYAASKHALHGFFDALRAELYPYNIDISLICPGFVRTNISINALTETGAPLNKMDAKQAEGMSAKKFADKAIRALEKRKKEVYIGKKEVLMVYIKRYIPILYYYLIRKVSVR
jgi:short-subunit dehydrogenase